MSAERSPAPGPGFSPNPDLRRLVDNLPGMAYQCRDDPDRTVFFASGGAKELTGFAPDDLIGNRVVSYARLIVDEDRERVQATVRQALQDGRPFALTYRIRRADGGERWVWEQGRGAYDGQGQALYVEGHVADITGRYELATQLAETETWNRILLSQPLVGVYVIDEEHFRFVNARFAEIFGRTSEELLALPSVLDVVAPEDRGLVAASLGALTSGKAIADTLRFRALHGTGAVIHVEVHRTAVSLAGSRVIMGVLINVTDQIEAEQRARHLQKMEAMGRLAAGIAHDFRNVLAAIRVTAQLLQEEVEHSPETDEDLRDIVDAVDRGSRLSQQLMELGANRSTGAKPLSLSEEVSRIAPMLRRILGRDVTLDEEADASLPDIVVDRGHLEQILMNLVVNARDAMPNGGKVTVRSRLKSTSLNGAPYVCLEVSDTGPGVPMELRARVFEPYFTTKHDKGTGLGLSNVWSIARGYGGFVELESEDGRGTTFLVHFPAHVRAG